MTDENKNPLAPFWVEGDDGARYRCRPLTGFETLEIDFAVDAGGDLVPTPKSKRTAVEYGLIGWEGRTEKFSKLAASRLPWITLLRLAAEILKASNWSEEEEKNS